MIDMDTEPISLEGACLNAIVRCFADAKYAKQPEPAEAPAPTTEMPTEEGLYWAVTMEAYIDNAAPYNAIVYVYRNGLHPRVDAYSIDPHPCNATFRKRNAVLWYGPRIEPPPGRLPDKKHAN